MLIRAVHDLRHCDLDVVVHDAHATVAELAQALTPGRPIGPIAIDGHLAAPGDRLDGTTFGAGSVVDLGPPTLRSWRPTEQRPGQPAAGVRVTVTSGFDTGRQVAVPPGRWLLGRPEPGPPAPRLGLIPVDDPSVAPDHADLLVTADGQVMVTDRASGCATRIVTGGTDAGKGAGEQGDIDRSQRRIGRRLVGLVMGRLRHRRGRALEDGLGPQAVPVRSGDVMVMGGAQLTVVPATTPPGVEPPARGSATRPVHRRPRPPWPGDPAPVEAPDPPGSPPSVTPVGLVAVIVSLLAGAAMVWFLHSWAYAAFAAIGPLLLVANGLDSRRRRRRVSRRSSRRWRRDLLRFERSLVGAAEAAQARALVLHPGPTAVLDQMLGPTPACWARRAGHPDAYAVRLGTGAVPWAPPVSADADCHDPDLARIVERHNTLEDAAVGCRLDPSAPLAVVGPRSAALALVRSILVQAVVDHGPADLVVAVLTDRRRSSDWQWCRWLPHVRGDEGERLLAECPDGAEHLAVRLLAQPMAGTLRPRTIVVLDDPTGLAARRSGVRTLLRAATDPAKELVPIVVTTCGHDVPAVCATALTVTRDGRLTGPSWIVQGEAQLVGVGVSTADEVARRLARLDDPEVDDSNRNLPGEVALATLSGLDATDPGAIANQWRTAGSDPAPVATLGSAADGPLVVDLATDGPHALVAGTTGSGKSELLRTLVASLALGAGPDHLTFVLVDFKGGSAFDSCGRLPHTTGVVTDLDDHLAARALRCLEAELRQREIRLRRSGAEDLTAWRRRHPDGDAEGPLPRLVVVVDEFATLAAELPEFVDALVGIAQRGRSLGVHLVLATQRPSGAVSENIRANANLRIALRMQDVGDSRDVIDRPDAVDLPRRHPGRALAKLGPDEMVAFQTASVSGRSNGRASSVTARPALFTEPLHDPSADGRGRPTRSTRPLSHGGSDLDQLVAATIQAWEGGRRPRRPWPDPLPSTLALGDPRLEPHGSPLETALALGLADDPDHQQYVPFHWLLDQGPLLGIGLSGSGTTTLAATAVLAGAHRWSPDDFHVHILDLGSGDLRSLADLPHVGAVVVAGDDERQRRLLGSVAQDMARRRGSGGTRRMDAPTPKEPRRLIVVDGLAALRSRWDDLEPTGTWAHLVDLVTHGTGVGIHVLATVEGGRAVPHQVLAACRQRLVFRLAERSEHGAFGIAASSVPPLPPGRAVAAEGSRLVQVARPQPDLATAVGEIAGAWTDDHENGNNTQDRSVPSVPSVRSKRRAMAVDVLPQCIQLDRLSAPWGDADPDGSLALVVGVADRDLAVARIELPPGGHALLAGPQRSGRTTAVRTIAVSAYATGVRVVTVTRTPDAWPQAPWPVLTADDPALGAATEVVPGDALLVVVDDADLIVEDHLVLARLAGERVSNRHLVAAARPDRVRNRYGHWLREVLADRSGLLLRPDPDLDGELLGLRLPHQAAQSAPPGRGWMTTPAGPKLLQIAIAPVDMKHIEIYGADTNSN